MSRAEGVAEPVWYEHEPDEPASIESGQHIRRQRAGGDPAEQRVVGHEKGA